MTSDAQTFDLANMPLERGTTLVEASAGTGKTYSLAGLVLRLLLEGAVPDVSKILVMTFTNAATAELVTRIRRRLNEALAAFGCGATDDAFLAALLARHHAGDAQRTLRRALRDLDLLEVCTIHGFCRRMLDQNAFETGMPFDVEYIDDDRPLLRNAAEDFWRTTLGAGGELEAAVVACAKIGPGTFEEDYTTWRRHPGLRIEPTPLAFEEAVERLHELVAKTRAAGWSREEPLLDPMCGSGTFLIEGAWMAGDVAPGLARAGFGFEGWRGHDPALWQRVRAEAVERRAAGATRLAKLRIVGYDRDPGAVRAALANVEAAGLAGQVHVERRELRNMKPEPVAPSETCPAWIATNPPYGSRLPDGAAREALALLEAGLRRSAPGWRGLVLVPEREVRGMALDVRARVPVRNGPIECRLVTFEVPRARAGTGGVVQAADPDVAAFVGRVRKNLARLRKWIAKAQVEAYRVYDADVPQVAFAIEREYSWA